MWVESSKGFYHADCFFFLWEMEGAHATGYFTGVDQKIPDWLIKIIFLRKAETPITSGVKSRFGIMDFKHK